MKKTLAILLCLSLLLQCFAHYGILALYQLRKDYITRNLCENRDKPQMKCCGKCYLRKQLKKVDGNDTTNGTTLKTDKWEIVLYVLPATDQFVLPTNEAYDKPYNPKQTTVKNYSPLAGVFRPPAGILF